MQKSTRTRAAAAALLVCAIAAGCGGGGGRAGECIFASACSQASQGGGALPGNPAPVNYFQQGLGPSVLSLPTAVTAVRIKARTENPSAAFSVYANTSLIINTLIGSGQIPKELDGVYSVPPGGTLQIRNADAVNWEVTAVSVEAPSNPAAMFTKTGTGDTVFLLPARPAKYRIRGSFPGASSTFVVWVGSDLVVNTLVGTSWSPSAYDGTFSLVAAGGAQVNITGSNGVAWSFVEIP